ncbi:MAG: aspartate kinase [Bacteroidota bacterium]|nr:aspartate kinase [Bacteroidota bacterium]
MIVFKFGGASVKNADAVRNLANIIRKYAGEKLVIVVSAMGKTTNALEKLFELAYLQQPYQKEFEQVKNFHLEILHELFPEPDARVFEEVEEEFGHLQQALKLPFQDRYDYGYDQCISFGEIISTRIVSAYLNKCGNANQWTDIRKYLKTDSTFREGQVNWKLSAKLFKQVFDFTATSMYVVQGFIGSDEENNTTTLGREGSDYTASIISYILNAEKVVIWKDVPGVLNADPKYFEDTVKIDQLSYLDAIELAYYGASIIHPKTIKPLQNKNIPLQVKSFIQPDEPGTMIGDINYDMAIPMFIFKQDQVLMRISATDFSFIAEEKLKGIFTCFARHKIKINLMQNSAISFQVCINDAPLRMVQLVDDLKHDFKVTYETGLELITIRHYDDSTIERMMRNKELILEQKSQRNVQLVAKAMG